MGEVPDSVQLFVERAIETATKEIISVTKEMLSKHEREISELRTQINMIERTRQRSFGAKEVLTFLMGAAILVVQILNLIHK